ncbi:MAG: CDP-glycerol glycerophosphotransferase family protein, partial [Clostridia bacterium]|nr:CDP-glycerol glycerophosphotransferase family protein [Clostridia bacterium]
MTRARLLLSCVASHAARALLRPLALLPIRKNRVLFLSFRGKQYSCNPKYVSEALQTISGGCLEIVWAFHEPQKFKFLEREGIRVLSDRSLRFLLCALTARVVCTNTYYKPFLPRRRGQFYLRTWHGGGAYKRVDYPKGLMGHYIRMQQEGADLYLSSSRAFTQMTLREAFGYQGEVLECGMPRNDLLVTGAWRSAAKRVREQLSLNEARLALYAPTWREEGSAAQPDVERLRSALSARFGDTWVIAFRGHHAASGAQRADVDLTAYPDMQELLCAADVLITDYSSSIWDMSLTGKPAFLYCRDLASYTRERDPALCTD